MTNETRLTAEDVATEWLSRNGCYVASDQFKLAEIIQSYADQCVREALKEDDRKLVAAIHRKNAALCDIANLHKKNAVLKLRNDDLVAKEMVFRGVYDFAHVSAPNTASTIPAPAQASA